LDVFPQDPEILDDLLEAYRRVLRGEAKLEKCESHLAAGRFSTCTVWKKAYPGVDPENIWEPGEPHIIP